MILVMIINVIYYISFLSVMDRWFCLTNLWSIFRVFLSLKIREFGYKHDLDHTFSGICCNMFISKHGWWDEINEKWNRGQLREQNERMTRLEMENDALKITVTKLEKDNLLMKDRLVNISDENKALKQEVSDLRRHVTTIQEYSNIENLDKQEEPSGAFRETAVHRKCTYQTTCIFL